MSNYTKEFVAISKKSDEAKEKNDCAVKAISLITGKPYAVVRILFRRFGRRSRGTAKMETIQKVMDHMGLKTEEIVFPPKTVERCEWELHPQAKFLIFTSGHMLAMCNGQVMDWTQGKKHRPKRICRVLN